MTHHHTTTLVLGGTGKTGRRVAERLAAAGVPVRLGSRSATPPFDWDDPSTWAPVVEGVDAVYVTFQPDLAVPGAPDAVGGFTSTAVAAGARRFVLLSGRGEPGAAAAERRLAEVAPEWTVLRSAWFSQNFSEHVFLDAVRSGVLAVPAGDVAEPFVDCDDLADAAVAALLGDGHLGRTYELTGPRLLTFTQVAEILSEALGRTIRYQPTGAAEYVQGAIAAGVHPEEAEGLAELFTTVLDGRNAHLTDDLGSILGRPGRDLAELVAATAPTGVWDPREEAA